MQKSLKIFSMDSLSLLEEEQVKTLQGQLFVQ
jgi:hypothetical protein